MNKHQSPIRHLGVAVVLTVASLAGPAMSQTTLANQPVFSAFAVPGNLALALSVEFPTAVSNAHIENYTTASTYLGYFDPNKCYDYVYASGYFQPAGVATGRACNGKKWSGNFLNWATMQTIDPFRWALTGGYRVTDNATTTILEKAYASGQGSTGNFPDRTITSSNVIAGATPLGWAGIRLRVQGLGANLRFTRNGNNYDESRINAFTAPGNNGWSEDSVWQVVVRVKVCDPSTAAGGLESNCVAYDGGNFKPEGLIQKYSSKIRFSAFGYLNDSDLNRDGGVLRAKQKFVGPTRPVPGSDPVANAGFEWDASTGVMVKNPDRADALATATSWGITIQDSGVMNYLNKFGEINPGSYKTYDPVGELYYAALRYLRNMPNVPEWTNPPTGSTARATQADGFPVITTWEDPILYSCQRNFILGIGDVNTHADRNLPGSTGRSEPSKPAAVSADTAFDATIWTNKVGALSGVDASLSNQQPYNGCCTNNGALMAGMAYWANTQDIRPTMDGKQTVKTYWLDVQELQTYKANNQFYLATRYGGATIPSDWDALGTSTDLPVSAWHTGPTSDTVGGQLRPDTYYTAAKADQMVNGLNSAFASIVSSIAAFTSSVNTAGNDVDSGTESYSSSYESAGWTGRISAFSINMLGNPIAYNFAWEFSDKLATQLGTDGNGWDTRRRVVTFAPASGNTPGAGIVFRYNSLTSTQQTAINPTYTSASDGADFVAYVRGDKKNEANSPSPTSTRAYRVRNSYVGDIINSQVVVLGPPPAGLLADAANPGYSAFATARSLQPNILIAGANSGLVHVINGSTTRADGGSEIFAYIPSPAITGPGSTPSVDGIAATGNPDYEHRYLIDARPQVAYVDVARTGGSTTTGQWRSIAVGGLGKGGKSIWALNLTDVNDVTTEAAAAQRVMWEFKDADLGFTFGTPVITKTAQWGWVVVVGSGYNNNATGKGYFYILNAATGALIQKIALGAGDDGTAQAPAGVTHLQTYYRDRTDATVESIYAGDLRGNLWRLDLTATSGAYPAPVKLAKLTNAAGGELPVTSSPTPVINSNGNRRWVVVGTGQLLSTDDLTATRTNRVYAIMDGYQARPTIATDLPTGITLPFTESTLRHDFLNISTTAAAVDPTTKVGYVIDVPTATGSAGYQIVSEADALDNLVAIAAVRPSSTDACSAGGSSRVLTIDLNTGVTSKINATFVVDAVRFIKDRNDSVKLVIAGRPGIDDNGGGNCGAGGEPCCVSDCTADTGMAATGSGRLINWREIPLRN
ncbi:pilus assembly protein [Roseateles sp. L2-2]|uniref:pilus assembly protein n=1 Tax=Roseateles sp. L2-2 TaxID=3422597 RepID=UPI003D366BF9